jgi:hypothetical protein
MYICIYIYIYMYIFIYIHDFSRLRVKHHAMILYAGVDTYNSKDFLYRHSGEVRGQILYTGALTYCTASLLVFTAKKNMSLRKGLERN